MYLVAENLIRRRSFVLRLILLQKVVFQAGVAAGVQILVQRVVQLDLHRILWLSTITQSVFRDCSFHLVTVSQVRLRPNVSIQKHRKHVDFLSAR